MPSDTEALDNDSLAGLPKAVSLTNPHSNTSQQPSSTITHAPAFDQFNDKLFKSIQQCIESALEPLAQRMADIEKAMIVRTASIAEQVSTVSLNQQVLHQSLLNIMEKVNQLQFEEQSVYTDEESLSSFDIPARRSARNADNVSVCSTEASVYLSNSEAEDDEEDDGDSVCTETAETLNQFQIPEAASVNAERYNQFTRIESRKYTAKFNTASQSTPSSSLSTDQISTVNAPSNSKPLEQTVRAATEPPKLIPGIPVVPQTNTAANATSASSLVSANTAISPTTPIHQPRPSLTSAAAPTLLKKEPVLTAAPVTKKAQPITIAPIAVSVPIPTSAAEPPSCTITTQASSEPSEPAGIPNPVIVPLVEAQGNRSNPNQRRNRREPIDKKFAYVYFKYATSRSRTKCNDVRAKLTAIGIPSKKLLDVYFPRREMAAVLFPESYLDEAIDIMEKNDFTLLTHFNPLDSENLGDPKYKNLSKEERNEILRDFHEKQMCRAIDRVRYPTKSYVYGDFYKKGWISKETYRHYVADMFRTTRTVSPFK